MNELSKSHIISDLQHCRAMFKTMISAIEEFTHNPNHITNKDLRKQICNIKSELRYMSIEIDFYLTNVGLVDKQTLANLTMELNNSTTQAHQTLKSYKKYMQEGDF